MMRLKQQLPLHNIALITGLCLAMSSATVHATNDNFLVAEQAFKRNDVDLLASLNLQMQGDTLAMYPAYFLLNTSLVTQTPDSILAFVALYPKAALSEKIAADYIEEKVKAGEYGDAIALINKVNNADSNEACAIAVVQDFSGDNSALKALKSELWLKANKVSDLCHIAAKQMVDSQKLGFSQADMLQRLWVMLSGDRLKDAIHTATAMGLTLDESSLRLAGAEPTFYLENPALSTYEDQAMFLYAVSKLADQDLFAAEQAIKNQENKIPASIKSYAYRLLALSRLKNTVTQGFDSRVVGWFDNSLGAPFSDDEADAYARQAIRFGAWESVLHALDVMSPSKQEERLWKYWFARAVEKRDDPKAKKMAQQFYTALATEHDYYGLLAKDRLGIKFSRLETDYVPTAADYDRLNKDPSFSRAFALRDLNATPSYANREWNWGVRQALQNNDEGLLMAAAAKANMMQWYDRAIYAADKTKKLHNYTFSYPVPYQDEVQAYSQQFGIDPAWVYGLTRQESRFIMNARSNVGAGGLMQIMPNTAKWIANRLGESYSASKLSDMDTNIRFGTFYLSHVFEQLSNNAVLATAGYNAGPNRAKRWQPDNASLAPDQYTECIPFLETRDYVKNVMTNAAHYAIRFRQGDQSIVARMGDIPTRSRLDVVGP